jgi:hypothetical protein
MKFFAFPMVRGVGFAPVLVVLLVRWQTVSAQVTVGDVSQVRPMLERLDSESQNGLRDAREIFQLQNGPKELGETALLGLGLVHAKLVERDLFEQWERSTLKLSRCSNHTLQFRLQLCLDFMQKDAIEARSHFIDLMRAVLAEGLDKTTSKLNGEFLGRLIAMQESPDAPKILPAEILKIAHSRLLSSKNRPLCTAYQLSYATSSSHFQKLQQWFGTQKGVPDDQIATIANREIVEYRGQLAQLEKSLVQLSSEKAKVNALSNQLIKERDELQAQYQSIEREIQSNPQIRSPMPPNFAAIRASVPKSRYMEASSTTVQSSGVPRFGNRSFRSRPPMNFNGNQNVIVNNLMGWMPRSQQEIDSEAMTIYAQGERIYLQQLEQRRVLTAKIESQRQLLRSKQDEIVKVRQEGDVLDREKREVKQQSEHLEQQIQNLELFAKAGTSGDIHLIFHSPLYELLDFTNEKKAILAKP